MLDRSGVRRIRYEDVFRALGHYLDAQQLHEFALAETPDGFILKAWHLVAPGRFEASDPILFANEDIDALLEEAYHRRRAARAEHASPLRREPQARPRPSEPPAPPNSAPPAEVAQPTATTAPSTPPAPRAAQPQPAPKPQMPGGRGWLRRS